MTHTHDRIRAIVWRDDTLELLDQRQLPNITDYLRFTDVAAVAQAIQDMVVRGAPAIGITAAYGVVIAARTRYQENPADWKSLIQTDIATLAAARPTAVNLHWALQRMAKLIAELKAIADKVSPFLTVYFRAAMSSASVRLPASNSACSRGIISI